MLNNNNNNDTNNDNNDNDNWAVAQLCRFSGEREYDVLRNASENEARQEMTRLWGEYESSQGHFRYGLFQGDTPKSMTY